MRLSAIVWLFFGAAVHAETLTGRVVGISDGDTITVLVEQRQVKVRLADIAAGEQATVRFTLEAGTIGSVLPEGCEAGDAGEGSLRPHYRYRLLCRQE